MKNRSVVKSLYLLFSAVLVAVLVLSVAPASRASADETVPTSDLAVSLVSIQKRARACEVFEAFYRVTNLGPDPAYHLYYGVSIPDQYEVVGIMRAPEALDVGHTVTFSVVLKVTAFVPGESRTGWVGIGVVTDSYPGGSLDPNPDNNGVSTATKLVSKPVMNCWE